MLRLFRQNGAGQYLVLLATTALLWWRAFANPMPAQAYDGFAPLYAPLCRLFDTLPHLSVLVALLLVVAQGIMLCAMLNNHRMLPQNTLLPLLFYVTAMSLHPARQTLGPVLLTNLCTLLALSQLMRSQNSTLPLPNLFNGALFAALAILFYLPAATLLLPLLLAMVLYRLYRWRQWMTLLLGLLAPFLPLLVHYFMTDQLGAAFSLMGSDMTRLAWSVGTPSTLAMVADALFALLLLAALVALAAERGGLTNEMRLKRTLVWLVLLSNIAMMAEDDLLPMNTQLLALPFALALTAYYLRLKRRSGWVDTAVATLVVVAAADLTH